MSTGLPTGLRAVVTEYGSDQADAVERCVRLEPQPAPRLDELVDGDLVIAVKAAEVVWTDTVMATGQYQHQAQVPYSPGMTYAGVVAFATAGAKAKGVDVGARVAIAGGAGPRTSGRYQRWGGCATYAVAPVAAVRKVPGHWNFDQAACFAYGYDTAHYCIVECGQVKAGETVLVHGATGGVGIPAVRMCKMLGATVIATTRSESKLHFLKEVGADHAVLIQPGEGLKQLRNDVKRLTKGQGVDVVYDGVGGDLTVESMRCCRFNARLLVVGWASTPNVAKGKGERGAPNANQIPTNLIMMKGLRVLGCPAMISLGFDRTILARRLKDLDAWLEQGKLPPPVIASAFGLEDVKEALKVRIASGQDVGSTVVRPPLAKL